MPITRAKATALLNQREMALYDDSRANAIRTLDEKALSVRITRARAVRDRARDLVQRQKLSSRDRTGNKRGASGLANQRSKDKVELTTDILRRFEAQLDKVADASTGKAGSTPASGRKRANKAARTPAHKSASRRADRRDARATARDAERSAKAGKSAAKKPAKKATKTATKKSTAGKATTKAKKPAKTAVTSATAKRAKKASASPAARSATTKKSAARTSPAQKAPAMDTAARATGKKAVRKATKKLTPKQALKRTQSLLKAKQERDRAPKPWQTIGAPASEAGQPGYQSDTAARRAQELHAGEARMPAIKGSISTRDRINQGKRDSRND